MDNAAGMDGKELARAASEYLARVRETRPLVHNITNWVVTNVTANALLSIGASPVMAHAMEEVEEMVGIASALVLNIGTLTPSLVEAMVMAGRQARRRGIPVVFDPVGAGATALRTRSAERIIAEVGPTVVRGNVSEISVVGGLGGQSRGVDAGIAGGRPSEVALRVAEKLGCVVAVTGARDFISDGSLMIGCDNGHPLLTAVTGTGCMATALIGAFVGAASTAGRAGTAGGAGEFMRATAAALACFGLAAERAAASVQGPGSFQAALFDELYRLSPEDLAAGARLLDAGGDL